MAGYDKFLSPCALLSSILAKTGPASAAGSYSGATELTAFGQKLSRMEVIRN